MTQEWKKECINEMNGEWMDELMNKWIKGKLVKK